MLFFLLKHCMTKTAAENKVELFLTDITYKYISINPNKKYNHVSLYVIISNSQTKKRNKPPTHTHKIAKSNAKLFFISYSIGSNSFTPPPH